MRGVESYKSKVFYIGAAAKALGVPSQHLRVLEWEGRIPPARRDLIGHYYSEFDLLLFRAMGIGQQSHWLKSAKEVLKAARS
jgi:DNA-binding transcriptional MerR regulator